MGLEETIDDLLLTLLMGLALEHDDAANVERAVLAMPDDLVFLNQGEQRQLGDFLVVEDTNTDVAVLRRLDATEDGERTEVVNTLDVVHQVRELVRCHLRRLGEQKGGAEPAQLPRPADRHIHLGTWSHDSNVGVGLNEALPVVVVAQLVALDEVPVLLGVVVRRPSRRFLLRREQIRKELAWFSHQSSST